MKQSAPPQTAAITAFTVLWAGVWLVVFLSSRGADAGQLPTLAGNFLRSFAAAGTDWSAPAARLLGVALALLIVGAWYGLGDLIERFLPGDDAGPLAVARRCALGAGGWSLLWFAFGAAHLYRRGVAWAALVAGVALLVAAILRARKGWRLPLNDAVSRTSAALLGMVLLLGLLAALAPPTAKDTLLYHFALPKEFIATGGHTVAPGNLASYLPLGVEMHGLWAMLLGGRAAEAAAGAVTFAFAPLLALALYGWAREMGLDAAWPLIAALLVASVPTAYYVTAHAYVDVALALYFALATHALARWWATLSSRHLWHAGLALGGALAIKLTAIYLALPMALVALWRARQSQQEGGQANRLLLTGAAALVLAGALASPWYVKTWTRTGSPFFPFYLNLWPGQAEGWDKGRSELFQMLNASYGGEDKGALDYLATPVKLSVFAEFDQPARYDGVLGVAFLAGLPLLLWGLWKLPLNAEVKIAAFLSGALYLFWLFSSQQLRYLLPALPTLAVAVCATAAQLKTRLLQWVFVACAAAGGLVSLAWFLELNPLPVALGRETRDAYLVRHLKYYPFYQTVNAELPPDAKVWLINMRRDTYYLQRPYFSDYLFEDYTLAQLVADSSNVADLRRRVREMGITHVLARRDVLLDPARSVIVDPRLDAAKNDARMQMVKDFLTQGTKIIRQDDRLYLLVELPH
jgi:hypothetical protein